MKKLLLALLIVLSLMIVPFSNTNAAGKIKLNKTKATIKVGQTIKLKVNKKKIKIKWKTSNKKVASVSKKGKVKGKKPGKATITAKYGKKKLKCKIIVKSKGNISNTNGGKTNSQSLPIKHAEGKNEKEVKMLAQIIAGLKSRQAKVSDDLESNQYSWDKNGNLSSIEWDDVGLSGELTLTGFEKLQVIHCRFNKLTTVDASNLPELEYLRCDDNQTIQSINVSNDIKLDCLHCEGNQIKTIDVSTCTKLMQLFCNSNQIETLDLSKNSILELVFCNNNKLSTLNTDNNPNLKRVGCESNKITSLNMSNNTKLELLKCDQSVVVTGCPDYVIERS